MGSAWRAVGIYLLEALIGLVIAGLAVGLACRVMALVGGW